MCPTIRGKAVADEHSRYLAHLFFGLQQIGGIETVFVVGHLECDTESCLNVGGGEQVQLFLLGLGGLNIY